MPLSAPHDGSIDVVLALANFEACTSGGEAIEPIHLLLALLKIIDGAFTGDAQTVGLPAHAITAAEAAGREARPLTRLSDKQLTALRRRLGKGLGSRSPLYLLKKLALSNASEDVLDRAAAAARSTGALELGAAHLVDPLLLHPVSCVSPLLSTPIQEVPAPEGGDERGAAISFGRNLTALARERRLTPVVGRRQEIKALARYLQRTSKRNVLLLGEAGVGKTAIVEGLAQRLSEPTAPEFLRRLSIVEIAVGELVADTAHRGDLEQRLRLLIEQASSNRNVVLFIDEIHLVMGAGAGQGALDVANILKPALARDNFRCIGATTTDEFERHMKRDAAFLRRFQLLRVGEPTEAEALEMCQAWSRRIEDVQDVTIDEDAILASVSLSARLIAGRMLPDKAIDLLENAASFAKITSLTFDAAAPTKERPRIGRAEIEAVLHEQYGVSATAAGAVDTQEIESQLRAQLVGQDAAIQAIRTSLNGLQQRPEETPRPLGVLLFVGPTGVGKTFTAELLSRAMFPGAASHLARFNMSELKEPHDLARLIGAPPGFIGHDRPGALFDFAERHPQGAILLDEMDKADAEIQDYFLQIFDKGEATDTRGRKTAFQRYLFIMTCNEIAAATPAHDIGFTASGEQRAGHRRVGALEGLRKLFRAELLARIDSIVTFRDLTSVDYKELLDRRLVRLVAEVSTRTGATVSLTTEARARLLTLCTRQHEGVRGFTRLFDRLLAAPVYQYLRGTTPATVSIDIGADGFALS